MYGMPGYVGIIVYASTHANATVLEKCYVFHIIEVVSHHINIDIEAVVEQVSAEPISSP